MLLYNPQVPPHRNNLHASERNQHRYLVHINNCLHCFPASRSVLMQQYISCNDGYYLTQAQLCPNKRRNFRLDFSISFFFSLRFSRLTNGPIYQNVQHMVMWPVTFRPKKWDSKWIKVNVIYTWKNPSKWSSVYTSQSRTKFWPSSAKQTQELYDLQVSDPCTEQDYI